MKDTETGEPNTPAKKKKPYVRPTCTVIPVRLEAALLANSYNSWSFGNPTDNPPHDEGPIDMYPDKPNKTSKFKHGYWVDDDEEEDW